MAAVELAAIVKSFAGIPVLRGVSLDIVDGEFLTLVGPSGCGKSTLLRIIAGLEAQDGGEIRIGARLVDGVPPKRRDVAMVFQSYALYPYMTVRENLALPLEMRRLRAIERLPLLGRCLPGARRIRRQIDEDVRALAAALSIAHLLERRPAQLSGGQRQRTALGRAMVRQPQVFLMDEPLSNLDANLRVETRTEIAELHRRLKTTFIYVTHDQAEAMTMADRVAVMLGGQIIQVAPPQQIYDAPAELSVAQFIGTPKINVLAGRISAAGGIEVPGGSWPLQVGCAEADRVSLGIRPEAWELDKEPAKRPQGCLLAGRVRHLEHLGAETLVHFAVADTEPALVARVAPAIAADLSIGAAISARAKPDHILVFDAGGKRIPVSAERTSALRQVANA
jgi:multiple sugar transport system ATP-binding protein